MVSVLKKGASTARIKKLLDNLIKSNNQKGLDAHKFCGTISFKRDGLKIQKELRNEWK